MIHTAALTRGRLGAGNTTVTDQFTPTARTPNAVQGIVDKIRRGEMTPEEIKALPESVREQLRGIDRGDGRDIFGKYTGSDTVSANKEALGLSQVGSLRGRDVITDQILVKIDGGSQGRRYDGLIHIGGNQYHGIEIKSGGARTTYDQPGSRQRDFDESISQSNPARGMLNGQPIEIVNVIVHNVR